MSDYLIINGESLEVEKKFDKCVVEGFGSTTENISTNTIIVPVGDTPGPIPPVDPFSGAWDLINNISQLTSAAKEEIITTIQENIDGFENWLATSDGKQIVFTKDQNFCFVKSYGACYATFGYKNTDAFPLILFFCNSSGTAVVERLIAPTSGMLTVGEFQVCWVTNYYPSPEILYGSSMTTELSANGFILSASIQSYYVADGRFGYSTGWSISEVETSYDPDPPGPEPTPGVTIEPLSVTLNGTYEESGKAYSPVTVNVPASSAQIDPDEISQVVGMRYFYTGGEYYSSEDQKVDALFKSYIDSGTNQSETVYSYTATEDCYFVVDPSSRSVANAAGDDGYVKVLVNGVQVYKTYLPSTYDQSGRYKVMENFQPIELDSGDTLTIVTGYDNTHAHCFTYLYWAISIVPDKAMPILDPQKIWRGSVSQYDELSTIEDDRVYIITNSTNCPYMKLGSVSITPPSEPGYEAVIRDYTSPSNGSFSDYIIPIAQINKYPSKGWQLEFNVNATNRDRDNVICGIGSGGTGLREVYIKQNGTLWLYDYDSFGDNQVYSGSITNKDVIIRRAIGSGSFEVIVDGDTVYTGTLSNYSNGYTLAVGNYNSNYNFTGTINYLKFKWLE